MRYRCHNISCVWCFHLKYNNNNVPIKCFSFISTVWPNRPILGFHIHGARGSSFYYSQHSSLLLFSFSSSSNIKSFFTFSRGWMGQSHWIIFVIHMHYSLTLNPNFHLPLIWPKLLYHLDTQTPYFHIFHNVLFKHNQNHVCQTISVTFIL